MPTGGKSNAILLPVDRGRWVGSNDTSNLLRLAKDNRLLRRGILPCDTNWENENRKIEEGMNYYQSLNQRGEMKKKRKDV